MPTVPKNGNASGSSILIMSTAQLDEKKLKGPGWKVTEYEMGGNSLIGHIADWPAGMYNKAHYHGAGAIQKRGAVPEREKCLDSSHPFRSFGGGDPLTASRQCELKRRASIVVCCRPQP